MGRTNPHAGLAAAAKAKRDAEPERAVMWAACAEIEAILKRWEAIRD